MIKENKMQIDKTYALVNVLFFVAYYNYVFHFHFQKRKK